MAMVDKARPDGSYPQYVASKQAATSARGRAWKRLIPPAVAAAFLIAALVLPHFMFHKGQRADVPGLGPGAWPSVILGVLAACSALWLALELRLLAKWQVSTTLSAPQDEETYHYEKALLGIALVIAFGWLLPILGFTIATTLFLLVWCLYGGLRHPLVLLLVPTVGTVALLWMFMGLALMPLSRGVGPFEHFSVRFLQLVGIY